MQCFTLDEINTHLPRCNGSSKPLLAGLFVLLALLEESLRDFDVLSQWKICQNPSRVTESFQRYQQTWTVGTLQFHEVSSE